jgi:hypothetical protein
MHRSVLVRNRASIVTVTGFVSAAGVRRGDSRAANPRTSQRFWQQSAKIRRPDASRETEADRRAFPIINAMPHAPYPSRWDACGRVVRTDPAQLPVICG